MLLWSAAVIFVAPVLSNVFATAQSQRVETPTWPAFFALGRMTLGTWYGILLFGFLTSFLFGREYAQGVAVGMLTAPTRRESIVFAKMAVLAVWVFALALLAILSQALAATVLGLHGFAWAELWPLVGDMFTVALLVFLTQPLVAVVAVASRGVFAPMIFSAAGFLAGMIGGIAGWGEWLPWAMPTAITGSFLGPVVSLGIQLNAGSWAIAGGTFVIGLLGLLLWVDHADAPC